MEKIVIIGANQYQDPLIRKAKAMGLETHVFAWQTGDPGEYSADYFYPISITNQNFILDECRRLKPSAVISGASDLAMNTVGHIASKLGLVSNSPRAIQLTTNKLEMRRALEKAGITQPAFAEIGDRMPEEDIRTLRYPLVVKPSDRSGGRSVVRVDSEQALRRTAAEARDLSFERRAIVEEYIAGKYYSVETISHQGVHHVLAVTENEVVEQDGVFIETAHRQPVKLRGELVSMLEKTACTALDALEVTVGAAHTEFVLTPDDTAYLIEVSGSMGGDFIGSDLTPLSTGSDYLRMIIDVARGKAPDLSAAGRKQDAEIRFIACTADMERWNEFRQTHGAAVVRSHFYQESGTPPERPGKRRYGYYITARRPREMGGYLPLELERGREYFRDIPVEQLRRLNSGRTAVWYAVRSCTPGRVFVPHFCAPAVAQAVQEAGAEAVFYGIDEAFAPADLCPGEGDAVLLVNYYGLLDEPIRHYVEAHPGQTVLIDNAGAFFCPPILRDNVYNIYSCRKFIGVPDGAYLIGGPLAELELEEDYSAERSGFLLHSFEQGTSGAYQMSLDNERALAQRRARMSELTLRLLDSVDYERLRQARRDNYQRLHELLGEKNRLKLELGTCAPQYYPFLWDMGLRERLVRQRVYLPVLWRKCLTPEFSGTVEQRYGSQVCCLPIDQRYGAEDMRVLGELILDHLD